MKTKKLLNCKFTDEEMRQFGITLAQEAQRKERLEDAKKQSASQFKADIDAVDAQIRSLSQKLARGSEDRYVDCDVFFNSPEEGKKTIVRTDTGETLSVSPMSEDELQDLFINELGARKEQHEFVFRDKSRCKLVSLEEFQRISRGGKATFRHLCDRTFTEKELVDSKPESLDFVLIVYAEISGEDQFEVMKCVEIPDAKQLSGGAE